MTSMHPFGLLVAVGFLAAAAGCPGDPGAGYDGGSPDATVDAGTDGGDGCPAGEHDGGDGACVAEGQCSSGHHDGGDGSCVPEGLCATGYHDGGESSCVPEGLCLFGYHDGSDGSCVIEGTCIEGSRPDGRGICGPIEFCTAGLIVTPQSGDIGEVVLGQESKRTFELSNPAPQDQCALAHLELMAGTDPAFSLPAGELTGIILAPGEAIEVEVAFVPEADGEVGGFLLAEDGAGNRSIVRLRGRGLDVAASLQPGAIDFGSVMAPCSRSTAEVCLINEGGLEMMVTDGTLSVNEDLWIEEGPLVPVLLAPGEGACWTLAYSPGGVDVDVASMRFLIEPGSLELTLPITGEGVASVAAVDTFLQTDQKKADILWVINASPSLVNEQQALAAAVPNLIAQLEQAKVDYRLGVITADRFQDPATGYWGTLIGTWLQRAPYFVDATMQDPASAFAADLTMEARSFGSLDLFEAAIAALSSPLIDRSEWNGSFLRPEAHLALVFVSNVQENENFNLDFSVLPRLWSIKGVARQDLFVASAIVGPPPSGCNAGGSAAGPAPQSWELAARTGGAQISLCAFDIGPALADTLTTFDRVSRFPLTGGRALPGTPQVTLIAADGDRTSAAGWAYAPQHNAIDFPPGSIPLAGETVEVTYQAECP